MITATSLVTRGRRLLRSRLGIRFTRYTGSSLVAVGVGQLAFLLVYTATDYHGGVASVVAFFAGAIPKYALNRMWAWERRGRPQMWRETLPYAAVVGTSLVLTALMTRTADHYVRQFVEADNLRTFLVWAAFIGTNGLLFLVKFVLFDRVVFSDPSREQPPGRPEPAEL